MNSFPVDEDIDVFVEFPSAPGRHQVAKKPEIAAQESAMALDKSMGTIQYMAHSFTSAMNALGKIRPEEMELEFGIKFDTEVGAIIAKTGLEANLNVKLVWKGGEENAESNGT